MTEAMSPTDSTPRGSQAADNPDSAKPDQLVLCPYCGATQRGGDRCGTCGGLFEPLSQKATQIAMGPWYIRDKTNPFRPGCSYDVLVQMIEAGRINPTTVLRGPSTRQFWSVARNVEGVAHLLGYCHRCHAHVKPEDQTCGSCGEAFRPVKARNELGLRYKTRADAAKAKLELDAQIEETVTGNTRRQPRGRPASGPLAPDTPIKSEAGLLDEDGAPAKRTADGQTLDFTPSDDAEAGKTALRAFDTKHEGTVAPSLTLPASPGMKIALWILIGLNILSFGGLAALYVWTQGG